jgi:hypothetical protein
MSMPPIPRTSLQKTIFATAVSVVVAAAGMVQAADKATKSEPPISATVGQAANKVAKPGAIVAGETVHFPDGYWSGLPATGPDNKVQQCLLVAQRPRAAADGTVDTVLSVIIGRGAGLAFSLGDAKIPPDAILDDEAEITLGDHAFPAVAFTVVSGTLAFHPVDAAAALAALAKTGKLRLRSDGDGLDTGVIALDLPADALAWLKQCGKQFDIAIDRPTDPNAGELPVPRPRSPDKASGRPTPAGPAGIEDIQKISGWDASELRGPQGNVLVCMIRRRYATGSEPGARRIATFLMASRARGLTMMLKDSNNKLPDGEAVDATLTIDSKPFDGFSARVLGSDEIGIFPLHGAALARALGDGVTVVFKSPKVSDDMTFPVLSGVVPWLRACARRWGIEMEPGEAKP